MPPPDLEIVEVMRGRDFHRPRSFFRIGIFVGDNRDQPADQRQPHFLALQMHVALIVRMHGDAGVAQHRFRPRRRDHDELAGLIARVVDDRIFEMPEMALGLDLHDFEVGNRRLQHRVPVDEALVLVDQPFPIELDEHFDDGAGEALVHGEAFARPVAGCSQTLQLIDDGAAGFGLPRPHPLQKLFAAHFAPARLLALHQLALDHHLRRDAGMVRARLPEHVLADASARSARGYPARSC